MQAGAGRGRGSKKHSEVGEAGKVVGNVQSLYIPFISYQFCVQRQRQEK